MGVVQLLRRLAGQSLSGEGDGDHPDPVPDQGFRFAFEQHPCAMAFVGPSLQIFTVNAAFSRMFGYSASELRTRTIHDLLPARAGELDLRALQGASSLHGEARFVTSAGALIWCELMVSAPNGDSPYRLATIEDISDRKSAEHELRSSQDGHRDLVENSGVLIGTHDMEGRIISANHALVRLFGYTSAEELIGVSIGDMLSPTVRHLFPAYLQTMRDIGHARGSMKVQTAQGEVRIIEYDNSVRRNGAASIIRCFGHDVTERVRAARALRASESRYRDLYDNNPAMYFTVDPAGIILSVNQFGAEQLGYCAAELAGQPVLSVFHEDDRESVQQQMSLLLSNPATLGHWEFRKRRRDGSILWVREVARALTRADGSSEVLIVCEDITERRRTEQALRDSEAQLRAVSDNMPNGAVYRRVKERNGRDYYSYMSAGILNLLGVAPEAVQLDPAALLDRVVEEDRPRVYTACDESTRTLGVFDVEVRMRTSTDQIKWIHFRAAPRRLPDEAIVWDGVLIDVTDARRDLEALLQAVNGIVWESEGDVSSQYVRETFISHQAERLLGYPVSEWLERPTLWLDQMHPDDMSRVLATRRVAVDAGRDYEVEYRMFASDGRTVWLREIVNVVLKDGNRVKLRGITVDTTESKRSEALLRESEERFRTMAESMPVALLIYRDDQWVYVNPAAEMVTGYTRAELLTMKIWELVHPQSRAYALERAELRQRGEPLPPRGELRMLTKAGREHWIEIIATPMVFEGLPSVLVTGFDITERARAEAALRSSKDALRRSHEQARELAGRLMLMQEEERRRISRELHDDVNQKLAALAISISRLKQEFPESAELAREQLTGLQHRMLSLSEDVRQLSHQLHPAALEHIGLVNALKSHCAEFSGREGIAVSLAIREGSEPIPLDMALCLYRVTQESLRNIAQHAGTRQAQVTLATTPEGINLSIADTGVGFDQERVKTKGGLGLVSMEERVRLLRGVMRVRSKPEGGTELHVHLPFASLKLAGV